LVKPLKQEIEMTSLKKIKDVVIADEISRQKDGSIMFRDGYFYRHGRTADEFRDDVVAALTKANVNHSVVDFGDHFVAPLARSSHFYVRVVLDDATQAERKAYGLGG
jgi:hypothetical protein